MRLWLTLGTFIHDHIGLILGVFLILLFITAWFVVELTRGNRSRSEMDRLRSRLYKLERNRGSAADLDLGPTVLPGRWIPVGGAATTSDGGCLVLVESASPVQKRAMLTIRVDGLVAKPHEAMMVGQRLEVEGKSGVYSIEMQATIKDQARCAISLRNRHLS